ncbi:Lysophospholipase L1 [Promicromonospora umidemergens]|uniref:SGNH hydrolase-type esterase domain-containing protein n=1 Tax=Promicromonospora umidemergens TaxID=629679 RepID=A0ABP8WN36_9MICO|nr:SGNH/GDSL hydrolase family protein [Promicromonospora umidemergens]MCP2283922.1 Lysophospholipase L1 [Promicromonospora umidemergens]
MKRWLMRGGIAVSVVVALATAVVVGMVMGAGGIATGGPVVGGTAAVAPPAPTPTPPAPSPAPRRAPENEAAAEPPVALFVGDSYTVGQRASSPAKRWSTLVAREMGWTERNVAEGGTGFVSRYPDESRLSYEEQLRSVRPKGVDLVVIAGGQNDFGELREDPEPVFRAVADTYALAAGRFPDAQIIAVGPSTPWEIGLEARALDSAVRAAAQEHGATYVSLLDPDVVRPGYVDPDGIHVNDEGYAAIASRVVAQIS